MRIRNPDIAAADKVQCLIDALNNCTPVVNVIQCHLTIISLAHSVGMYKVAYEYCDALLSRGSPLIKQKDNLYLTVATPERSTLVTLRSHLFAAMCHASSSSASAPASAFSLASASTLVFPTWMTRPTVYAALDAAETVTVSLKALSESADAVSAYTTWKVQMVSAEGQLKQAQAQAQAQSPAAASVAVSQPDSKAAGKASGKASGDCAICLELRPLMAFVPCGHVCCCTTCSGKVSKCPLCMAPIASKIKLFF